MILKSFQFKFTKIILLSFLMLSIITPLSVMASDGKYNSKKTVTTGELESISKNEIVTLLNENEEKDVLDILKDKNINTSTIKELLSQKDEVGKRIAFSIAKSIYSKTQKLNKLEEKLQEILDDHSEFKEADLNDSYFLTKNKKVIHEIIKVTIETPQDYSYRSSKNKCEFAVIRKFSKNENLSHTKNENLGYDNANKSYVNQAFICFGINGVKKEPGKNFWSGMTSLNTAYPKDPN